MLVLSTRIVLGCFYLLIFYSEKFSTDVCRLPYAVNVNLNLSITNPTNPLNSWDPVPLHVSFNFWRTFYFRPNSSGESRDRIVAIIQYIWDRRQKVKSPIVWDFSEI